MSEKLIRDNIPDIAKANGDLITVRIAAPDEAIPLLKAKLIEEAREVAESDPEHILDELADVLEVLWTLGELYGYNTFTVAMAARAKAVSRGGFVSSALKRLTRWR